jgi:carboxymethylenebutenolidase
MPDVTLRARDGHQLIAHRVEPDGTPRGAIVVVQEIFGVNAHVRAIAARFAGAGYVTIAPSFFDRVERGVELGYGEADFAKGREIVGKLAREHVLADLDAAVAAVAPAGKVGVVGYCWGGSTAWLAAAHTQGIACAVAYYGSRIAGMMDETPRVPTMMHVGKSDASFPMEKVEEIGRKHPAVIIHAYEAGHGFECDHRASFDAQATAIALGRTLRFFAEHVG